MWMPVLAVFVALAVACTGEGAAKAPDVEADEFTREALVIHAARRIGANGVVATVEQLVHQRGAPAHLRMDNGPELVSAALRDWCRIWGTHTAYIEPVGAENCDAPMFVNSRVG